MDMTATQIARELDISRSYLYYLKNNGAFQVELDENGTKAAAVTSISMETCSVAAPDPVVKNVDLTRPFAFLIYDSTNDEVLFMGKVVTVQ